MAYVPCPAPAKSTLMLGVAPSRRLELEAGALICGGPPQRRRTHWRVLRIGLLEPAGARRAVGGAGADEVAADLEPLRARARICLRRHGEDAERAVRARVPAVQTAAGCIDGEDLVLRRHAVHALVGGPAGADAVADVVEVAADVEQVADQGVRLDAAVGLQAPFGT